MIDEELARLLDHRLGGPDLIREPLVFVGLHVGPVPPSLSSGGSFQEPAGMNYSRSTLDNEVGWTSSAVAVSGPNQGSTVKLNAEVVDFGIAGGAWGEVTHAGLFAQASGGTPFSVSPVSPSRVIEGGDMVRFEPGGIVIIVRRIND